MLPYFRRHLRFLEQSARAGKRIPLTRFFLAVLGLIGLEVMLVVWLCELPARATALEPLPFAGPSILLTHPKGLLCLLVLLLGIAIATLCRNLTALTRKQPNEADVQLMKVKASMGHAFLLGGFAAAIVLLSRWGGG